ncbi:MAG TPA: ribosome-associated translation inhibitor RaiA [Streptosporangiaceae bacterium]|nr:ribosome-associated translation inhibitor RaiA [Streptosporangiaceae bacterium]
MTGHEGSSYVDIIFKARHTEVLERFRTHATAKLVKIEKLDSKAIRVDVEVMEEHNPRLSGQKERVELTVFSRGPKIRAEAAAEDRFAALDMALAKLESRLRRSCGRRKDHHDGVRLGDLPEADLASDAELPAIRLGAGGGLLAGHGASAAMADMAAAADKADAAAPAEPDAEGLVAVDMEGDGPLIVREKFHAAVAMSIDQALFEMELVGHDFFLFTDAASGLPSVVYRRRGYQYGVIRLVAEHAVGAAGDPRANAPQVPVRDRSSANGALPAASPEPAPAQARTPPHAPASRRAPVPRSAPAPRPPPSRPAQSSRLPAGAPPVPTGG